MQDKIKRIMLKEINEHIFIILPIFIGKDYDEDGICYYQGNGSFMAFFMRDSYRYFLVNQLSNKFFLLFAIFVELILCVLYV